MPEIGQTLGHYHILEHLGSGGMGSVYAARDLHLGRKVALKFLSKEFVSDPDVLRRFRNEALAAAELSHPNLATIHALELDGDEPFLVMEHLEGSTLDARLRTGPLSIETLLDVAGQISMGLDHAHSRGVIHRDIKGSNVFLTAEGQVKLVDFGLAHRVDATRITHAGAVLGTVAYMSPEQLRGRPADTRSDIWSVGVLLYECSLGHLPFRAESTAALATIICNEQPSAPLLERPELGSSLQRIVLRCLEKDPELRYQHADDLRADLLGVGRTLFPARFGHAPVANSGPRSLRRLWSRRVPQLAAICAASVIGVHLAAPPLVEALQLSGNVADLIRMAVLLFVPSLLLIISRNGRPRPRQRALGLLDLWMFPLNAVLAALILVARFHGEAIGPANEEVRVLNQSGALTTRVIPKPEFRRHVSLFYLDDATGDPDSGWLSYAFVDLLQADLSQDMRVELRSPLLELDRMRADGHPRAVNLSRPYQRELARAAGSERFVAGRVNRDGERYLLELELHTTRGGRLLTRRYEGSDPLELVDEISAQLRLDLDPPAPELDAAADLPIAELESNDWSSIEMATRGMLALYVDEDPAAAADALERAVAIDPSYASAQLLRFVAWSSPSHPRPNPERSADALRALREHLYRLPERQRLIAQSTVHLVEGDLEACESATRTRVTLFPDDADGWTTLARVQRLRGATADAIASFRQALAVDPSRGELEVQIATLQKEDGDLVAARTSLEHYLQHAATDPNGYEALARVLVELDETDAARRSLERAILLDPTSSSRRLALGEFFERIGDDAAARDVYWQTLTDATSSSDSTAALGALLRIHVLAGQPRQALQHARARWVLLQRDGPALDRLSAACELALLQAQSGQRAAADTTLTGVFAECPDGLRSFLALESIAPLLELGRTDRAEAEARLASDSADETAPPLIRARVLYEGAQVAMHRGEWAAALELLQAILEGIDLDGAVAEAEGSCMRELGSLAESEQALRRSIQAGPRRASARLELALTLEARGENAQAMLVVDEALTLWKDANPDFEPRRRALALRDRIVTADDSHR